MGEGPKKRGEKAFEEEGGVEASEREYVRELYAVSKRFLQTEKSRRLYRSMKETFDANPMDVQDQEMYKRGGFHQSKRKREFQEAGRQVAIERGIPSFNRAMGIPLGQRQLEPYIISGTDVIAEQDDTHHVNNPAIQQMLDDIRRTTLYNLDIPHRMLTVRAAKEVTPETIDLYLETLQHTMAGGAVAQEHMSEINPLLTADSYGKVITGSNEIKDSLDKRYLIDIREQFHPTKAEMLEEAIGDDIWLVLRTPTIAVRMGDGDCAHRWNAMQNTMAFISAYGLSGEHIVSDLAFSFKHARMVPMGKKMWYQRQRGQNQPGSIPDGYVADVQQSLRSFPARRYLDIVQTDEDEAKEIVRALAEANGISAVLENSLWFGFFMSGGIGFSNATAAGALAGNVIEDFSEELTELSHRYMQGVRKFPPKWDNVRFLVDAIIQYTMESYEKFPALAEFHWGGAIRISVIGAMGATVGGLLSGSSTMGLWGGHYAISLAMKEGWLRTGWAGQEVQDHVGQPYLCSFRPEEGNLAEMRGHNYPMQSFTAAHGSMRGAAIYSSMAGRGGAWATSPVVKVAFADPNLIFDFEHPKLCIAKACEKEFMPAGERDPTLPTH